MTAVPTQATILVVDDSPDGLELMRNVLGTDYKVRVAISGDMALTLVHQNRPDLILLDIMMPGRDGYDTCRELKADPALAAIPVIFITALGEVEDEALGFEVGAVDYITKPISPPLVRARVATHLALHRQKVELEQAWRKAEEGGRAKAEFLAMMSHEIRTPLTGILGMVKLLMETRVDGQQAEYLQTVNYSGEALLAIVNDILDFSKIDAGKLRIERIPFDLHQSLEGVVSLMGSRGHEKGLTMGLAVGPDVPVRVLGDPLRLRQVLLNLVGNAVKFTASGGVTVGVSQVARDGDLSRLRFTVSDTGDGIDTGARDHLFAEFAQGDDSVSRRFGGTGLGLAICRRLVTLMEGIIAVDSVVGEGSTFWFEIPLTRLNTPAPPPALDAPPAPERPLSVLVAEDNPVNQKVVMALLSRRGHNVRVVADGAAAVSAAENGEFDVVLLDMHMPVLDGLAATRQIRALPGRRGRVPVIAFTACAFEEDHQRCLAAGMNDFVSKPISPAALLATLSRVTAA
ncbi:MAG: response regulator [Magnetospirillum sp.]|nr:response regulator [Magnetospirillum sp.]